MKVLAALELLLVFIIAMRTIQKDMRLMKDKTNASRYIEASITNITACIWIVGIAVFNIAITIIMRFSK